ncbi:nucleotidyltransferase family protein [Nitrobacter sp. TKz-YC02]|uniref:nucleotidyltransferase family protein n=1 Tax=Nitrobacter sp. TKz-YC02 TaxID=3398704 RepID=UPI003CF51CDC
MAENSRSFTQLCACFRGCVPKRADWMSLLGLANETLTTPALMEFATRFEDQIGEDVYLYIREIFERNVARNDRFAAQLTELVAAMNDRGVTPVLLKGATMFATTARMRWGSRIMSDLDVMVLPDQIDATLDALFALGYVEHFLTPPTAKKWYIELKRPSDVGMVDLHRELPGPAFFYRSSGDTKPHFKMMPIGRGRAYVPSATYQALILIIHDQFQDSDYWIGNIDVRHLIELRDLVISPEGIDWDALAALTPSKLARNALETQLVALFRLLGVDVPARMRSRFVPRLQHRRRLAQARFSLLRQVLLPMVILDYRNYRTELGKSFSGAEIGGKWRLPKIDTLRFLLAFSREQRAGKV